MKKEVKEEEASLGRYVFPLSKLSVNVSVLLVVIYGAGSTS